MSLTAGLPEWVCFRVKDREKGPQLIEDEHIFELSPQDWTLLFLHSGWKMTFSATYYQYPRKLPLVSPFLAYYWRYTDFEGVLGGYSGKRYLLL